MRLWLHSIVRRSRYVGGPTWCLWLETGTKCYIAFEVIDELVRKVAQEECIAPEQAVRLMWRYQRG